MKTKKYSLTWNDLTLTQKAIILAFKSGQVPKFIQEHRAKKAKIETLTRV